MFRPLSPAQLAVDLTLAVLFGVVMSVGEVFGVTWPTFQGGVSAVAVALVLTAALAVRRLAPGLSLGIAWLAAVLQMAWGLSPRVSDVAIFAVLYVTAAYGSRLVFWLGFASTLVGAVVITLYLFLGAGFAGQVSYDSIPAAFAVLVAATFALLLSWVTGALVRTALRARDIRRAQQAAEAETATEQERGRIARDMHDVVAHSLAVVIAQADGARYAAASDPKAATDALATISTTARAALADVRLLLTQLRHSQAEGPQPTLADLEALYAQVRAAGVELRVDVDPAPPGLPPAAVQLAVYRILQEALTNALRHGSGGPVSVHLGWHNDRVELRVGNPVPDPRRDPAATVAGHGIIGMRERAQLVGGRFEAGVDNSGEDALFLVNATIPIGAPA